MSRASDQLEIYQHHSKHTKPREHPQRLFIYAHAPNILFALFSISAMKLWHGEQA